MKTALDTNILSALWLDEPTAPSVARALEAARQQGELILSPAVYAESLAHPFYSEPEIMEFLKLAEISVDFELSKEVWTEAGRRYSIYANRKRSSSSQVGPRRILADFVIGAHALLQADRLMTLDAAFYRRHFLELTLYPLGE